MGISGKVVLEDTTVEFELDAEQEFAEVAISDALTGKTCFIKASAEAFLKALAIALTKDGDVPSTPEEHEDWWKQAESVQLADPDLRFIP